MIATMSLRQFLLLAVLVGLGASLIVYTASDARNQDAPQTVPASPPAPLANTVLEESAVDAPQESGVLMVKTYEGYTPSELRLKHRPWGNVHAHDLITLMTDGTKDLGPRRRVPEALHKAHLDGDPDLSERLLREGQSALARFCQLHLLDALLSNDRQTRVFADDLLHGFWQGGFGYDPDDPKTWKVARRKWLKWLRNR